MVSIDESNHFVGFLCYKQTDEMNENFNIKSTKRIIVFTANSLVPWMFTAWKNHRIIQGILQSIFLSV